MQLQFTSLYIKHCSLIFMGVLFFIRYNIFYKYFLQLVTPNHGLTSERITDHLTGTTHGKVKLSLCTAQRHVGEEV